VGLLRLHSGIAYRSIASKSAAAVRPRAGQVVHSRQAVVEMLDRRVLLSAVHGIADAGALGGAPSRHPVTHAAVVMAEDPTAASLPLRERHAGVSAEHTALGEGERAQSSTAAFVGTWDDAWSGHAVSHSSNGPTMAVSGTVKLQISDITSDGSGFSGTLTWNGTDGLLVPQFATDGQITSYLKTPWPVSLTEPLDASNAQSAFVKQGRGLHVTINAGANSSVINAGNYGPWISVTLVSAGNGVLRFSDSKAPNDQFITHPYDQGGDVGTSLGAFSLASSDPLVPKAVNWNPKKGGVTLRYAVTGALAADTSVQLFYASGTTFDTIPEDESPIFSHDVAAGTRNGKVLLNVPGSAFASHPAPEGTQYLILVADPGAVVDSAPNVVAIADATLVAGYNSLGEPIDTSVLSDPSVAILKGLLRQAGQKSAIVSSTIRSPDDQARIMIGNEIRQTQSDYSTAGRNVLALYKRLTKGHNVNWIEDPVNGVQNAMVGLITNNSYGNYGYWSSAFRVSHHIQLPGAYFLYNVVDLQPSSFKGNGPLFEAAALRAAQSGIVTHFYDKKTHPRDGAYHFEIPAAGAAIPDVPANGAFDDTA